AILETTAALVAQHGLRAVTMAQIAEETGIGRATLYKYFPDVESILSARHDRHVSRHLANFAALRDQPGEVGAHLQAVLEACALMVYEESRMHHGVDLAALVHQKQHGGVRHELEHHRGAHVAKAQAQLTSFLRDMLAEGMRSGHVRDD